MYVCNNNLCDKLFESIVFQFIIKNYMKHLLFLNFKNALKQCKLLDETALADAMAKSPHTP